LIDNQVTSPVGFVFEFLDEVPIGASEEFPIDGARIVSIAEGSVLTEFHRETVEWTSVQSWVKTIDNGSSSPWKILDRHECLHVDPVFVWRCRSDHG
jgi:hypothetical protein